MNFFGNIGNAIKKGATGVGHAVGSALNNPIVKTVGTGLLAASGVGLPLAAAIGAGSGALGGALRPGGGLKGAITEGGQGALLGAGGSLAGTAGRMALGALGHGAAGAIPQGGASPATPDDGSGDHYQIGDNATGGSPSGGGGIDLGGLVKQGIGAIPGAIGAGVKGLGGVLTGNGGLNALGIAQGLNAAHLGQQSSDYANKAFNLQQDSYNQRAPLRALGLQGLTNPTAPNISGLQQVASASPFAPKVPALGAR